MLFFKPADQRGGICDRLELAIFTRQKISRQQSDFWLRITVRHLPRRPMDLVGHMAITHQRQHFTAIRRTRRAHKFNRSSHRLMNIN